MAGRLRVISQHDGGNHLLFETTLGPLVECEVVEGDEASAIVGDSNLGGPVSEPNQTDIVVLVKFPDQEAIDAAAEKAEQDQADHEAAWEKEQAEKAAAEEQAAKDMEQADAAAASNQDIPAGLPDDTKATEPEAGNATSYPGGDAVSEPVGGLATEGGQDVPGEPPAYPGGDQTTATAGASDRSSDSPGPGPRDSGTEPGWENPKGDHSYTENPTPQDAEGNPIPPSEQTEGQANPQPTSPSTTEPARPSEGNAL